MEKKQILNYLKSTGEEQVKLHQLAAKIRDENLGNNVYFRGIIEFSNICDNDCYYCGIRKSNDNVDRYLIDKKTIMKTVDWINNVGYGSLVLQSGELSSKKFTDYVTDIVKSVKDSHPGMEITLSVGEQNKDIYKQFFDAGAKRYLLRIETSSKRHYMLLHPADMDFDNRKKCLDDLKEIGFQVGTGVMIGSPYQTINNLADDLLFFKDFDIDMVGMGPFIPHNETPFGMDDRHDKLSSQEKLELSINMIATLRLMMPDINIAATTALQALSPTGRELGLLAGANIIMPIVTPIEFRENYKLYEGKPCMDETAGQCLECIVKRIKSVGMTPKFGEHGTSKHFEKRTRQEMI